ncbi:Response regulator receiver:Transcriptional regulatory protein, C-terminal [Pseudoalteromonas luteoviolacea B = ATCC 29581]|nr:Response regulator receiver:Transcriptional regulatory protein, C-terminal [Pseudoalteromonas luteoviolacea B = ATCC 29581]
MSNESNKYIGPSDAALLLNVNAMTIRRLCDKGALEFMVTPGGHRRILAASVEQYLNKNVQPHSLKKPMGLKVLLVDDDVQVINMLKLFITKADNEIQIESALGGFEAGFKVLEFKPDVVVTDLLMPDLNGIEVCQKLQQNPTTSHIRIIGITGTNDEGLISQFIDAGAQICLTKPLRRTEFIKALIS